MDVFGKNPDKRRRVSVKMSTPTTAPISAKYHATTYVGGLHSSTADAAAQSAQQVAAYIAEMCGGLVEMATGAHLPFLSYLLAMAEAEAEHASELQG